MSEDLRKYAKTCKFDDLRVSAAPVTIHEAKKHIEAFKKAYPQIPLFSAQMLLRFKDRNLF